MEFFLVGGAVRDAILGRPMKDRDYVVVGGSPEQMLERGFRQVGSDFPVFIDPATGEEYALARTERKNGRGYKGFDVYSAPDVTLEDDLARRDLTINAMAVDDTDHIVDPFEGQQDLENKVLRHVRAESFVEDPVRVLRLARFAARYSDFSVAPETLELCRSMVASGELDHLVAERVWQELAKGLMEDEPVKMFEVLRSCGALAVLLPELDRLWGVPQPAAHHPEVDTGVHVMMVLSQAAQRGASLEVRFACVMHDLGKGVTPQEQWPSHHIHEETGKALVEAICSRLKVPGPCRDLAFITCRDHTRVHRAMEMNERKLVDLLVQTDAIRRPERFFELLEACECDAKGRLGLEQRKYPQKQLLTRVLHEVRAIDAGAIAAQCKEAKHIPQRIHQARVSKAKAVCREIKAAMPAKEPHEQS